MAKTVFGEGVTLSKFHTLVDSDAFIGLFVPTDAHHQKTKTLFNKLQKEKLSPATTSFVVAETATVLSSRAGQSIAQKFLDTVKKFPVIHITEELQKEALDIFRKQRKKRTSVVDCANVVVVRHFKIPTIFSFDKFYSKQFQLKTLA